MQTELEEHSQDNYKMAPSTIVNEEKMHQGSKVKLSAGTPPQSTFFEDVHFLGDKDGKVVIRSPPSFTDTNKARAYQQQHLAAAFRVFAKQGFDEGVAGHISLRDPETPGK